MAELIYSDKPDVNLSERVRRTTQLKAEKLFRQKTLAAIEAQLHLK